MEKMKPGTDSALKKNKRADFKLPKVLIDGEIRAVGVYGKRILVI